MQGPAKNALEMDAKESVPLTLRARAVFIIALYSPEKRPYISLTYNQIAISIALAHAFFRSSEQDAAVADNAERSTLQRSNLLRIRPAIYDQVMSAFGG